MKFNFKGIDHQRQSEKKVKQRTGVKSSRKNYLIILGFFFLSFFILIVSPLFIGKSYEYDESQIGEEHALGNNIVSKLVNKQWNPETGLMQVDVELQSSVDNPTLSNIYYEAFIKYEGDLKAEVSYDILPVNPVYVVIFIYDVPKDFDVIGVALNPHYIEPEIESDQTLEQQVAQYTFYEENMSINEDLTVLPINAYKVNWLEAKQNHLKDNIESNQKEIELTNARIENFQKTIASISTDSKYLTQDEIEEQKENIKSLNLQIDAEEQKIIKMIDEVKAWEERIKLYDEEIQSYLNEDDWSEL